MSKKYKEDLVNVIRKHQDLTAYEAERIAERVIENQYKLGKVSKVKSAVGSSWVSFKIWHQESVVAPAIEMAIGIIWTMALIVGSIIYFLPSPYPMVRKTSDTAQFEGFFQACLTSNACIDSSLKDAYNKRLQNMQEGDTIVLDDSTGRLQFTITKKDYTYTVITDYRKL